MAERRETYAYFWVEGFSCDPSEISSILQLEPHETRKKGDLIQRQFERTGQKHHWPKSAWKLWSRLPLDETFQDSHIANLLEAIEPCATVLAELQKTCEMGINCVGYYWNSNPGFHLSADLIRRCARLGIGIDFDLYNFPEEHDQDGAATASGFAKPTD